MSQIGSKCKGAVRLCAIRDLWQFKTRIFYLYKICKQCK